MNVTEALQSRKSVRAYLDKPVSNELITRVLDAARWAPSGTNTQPWQVAVVTGEKKQQVQASILEAFQRGDKGKMDYLYYPEQWSEPYLSRRRACGLQLYGVLQIKKDDMARRMEQWIANYRAFDAPVVLFFFMENIMETGSYLDFGMFLQSVMLAAMDNGLATCPQAALADYPDLIRELLGYDSTMNLICGMALGYEDVDAVVNSYRTPREPVERFTQFF